MKDLKPTILELIKKHHLAGLATVTEDGKPWVRYVVLNVSDDLTLRTATFRNSRKVAHVKKNPEVHVTCGYDGDMMSPYIQVQAKAEVTDDKKERHALWNDHFKAYFKGPDDPNYVVMIIKPYRIELVEDASHQPKVWTK